MNQEKIGKFIAEVRKEKNLTQIELASKLGLTDRAISKWENGRGLPDLSTIKPLCEELGIQVNELLSGERLTKKTYQEKSEENILKTLDYSSKRIRQTKNKFKTIIIILLIIFSTLTMMFCIDIKQMRNNKPVIFSTWGYLYTPPIDLHEEEIENAITEYIINKNEVNKKYENEKCFTSFRTYLIDEKDKNNYIVYAWVLEEMYHQVNKEIKEESGSSIPHKFIIKKRNNKYVVTSSIIPRDGSLYVKDMKKIFPLSVRNEMNKVHQDGTIERLELEIKKQVELYYHK